MLLGLWLVALALVSGYTIKLLQDEDRLNAEGREHARLQALTLLGAHIETIVNSVLRRPFIALENLPPRELKGDKLGTIQGAFLPLSRIIFLDRSMEIAHSFPGASEKLDRLLVERVQLEEMTTRAAKFGLHVFVEPVPDHHLLLALGRQNDIDPEAGWILLAFDLTELLAQDVFPVIAQFDYQRDGQISLLGPYDEWPKNSIQVPITHSLPGYFLVFRPDSSDANSTSLPRALLISLSLSVLLALGVASWSAIYEVRRGQELLQLRQRFIANISHELKTPLALIRMYAETLHLKRLNDPARIHEYHRVILREAERLSEMIQNVLIFARLEHGESVSQLQHEDLSQTVSQVIEEMRPNFEGRGLALRETLADDLPPIPHDRHGVARILWNLLDNTVKYAKTQGADVRLYRAGEIARLEVADHGRGIPLAERTRLLGPFERGWDTDTIGGSGLGLALVAEIAKAHGADLSLMDEPGGGLCVRIDFPCA
jgi:signal transduction histidine kinase